LEVAVNGSMFFVCRDVEDSGWVDAGDEFEKMEIKMSQADGSEIFLTISRQRKKPEVIRLVEGEDPF